MEDWLKLLLMHKHLLNRIGQSQLFRLLSLSLRETVHAAEPEVQRVELNLLHLLLITLLLNPNQHYYPSSKTLIWVHIFDRWSDSTQTGGAESVPAPAPAFLLLQIRIIAESCLSLSIRLCFINSSTRTKPGGTEPGTVT